MQNIDKKENVAGFMEGAQYKGIPKIGELTEAQIQVFHEMEQVVQEGRNSATIMPNIEQLGTENRRYFDYLFYLNSLRCGKEEVIENIKKEQVINVSDIPNEETTSAIIDCLKNSRDATEKHVESDTEHAESDTEKHAESEAEKHAEETNGIRNVSSTQMYDASIQQPQLGMECSSNVSNFSCTVIAVLHNAETKSWEDIQLLLNLKFSPKDNRMFVCRQNEVQNIARLISSQYADAIIMNSKQFEISVRRQCANIPNAYWQIKNPGMYRIGNQYRYVTTNFRGSYPDLIVEMPEGFAGTKNYTITQSIQLVTSVLQVKAKSLMLLLYALLAITKKLFEDANFPIHFVLFVHGRSGSMKSAVCWEYFRFFNTEKMASFADTAAALETQLLKHNSRVFMVDDLHPGGSRAQQRERIVKLENLVRYVGDGVTRAKSDRRSGIIKVREVAGLVAVTSEYVPTECESSLSRCVRVSLSREEVDTNILSKIQLDSGIVQQLYMEFAGYVVSRQDEIVNHIRVEGPRLRMANIHQFQRGRTTDQFVCYALMLEIFCEFVEKMGIEPDVYRQLVNEIGELLRESEGITDIVTTQMEYTKKLVTYTENGTIRVASCQKDYFDGMHNFDGYWEEDYILFEENKIFRILQKENCSAEVSQKEKKEMVDEFRQNGIIVYFPNGKKKTRRKRKTFGKQEYSFVGINLNVASRLIQDIEEKEAIYM